MAARRSLQSRGEGSRNPPRFYSPIRIHATRSPRAPSTPRRCPVHAAQALPQSCLHRSGSPSSTRSATPLPRPPQPLPLHWFVPPSPPSTRPAPCCSLVHATRSTVPRPHCPPPRPGRPLRVHAARFPFTPPAPPPPSPRSPLPGSPVHTARSPAPRPGRLLRDHTAHPWSRPPAPRLSRLGRPLPRSRVHAARAPGELQLPQCPATAPRLPVLRSFRSGSQPGVRIRSRSAHSKGR